jgi:hypothetical protein
MTLVIWLGRLGERVRYILYSLLYCSSFHFGLFSGCIEGQEVFWGLRLLGRHLRGSFAFLGGLAGIMLGCFHRGFGYIRQHSRLIGSQGRSKIANNGKIHQVFSNFRGLLPYSTLIDEQLQVIRLAQLRSRIFDCI